MTFAEELYDTLDSDYLHVLTQFAEEGFKGIFVVLKVLSKHNHPMLAGQIADCIGISTARVAVALNTLDSKGYIIKSKVAGDKRKTLITLTPLGVSALHEREQKIKQLISYATRTLSSSEQTQLITLIHKMISGIVKEEVC